MSIKPNYWFPAKKIGWGWGLPITWQGWVVMVAFIALLFGGGFLLIPREQPLVFFGYALIVCAAMLLICWWKGEPPKWRWGGK